MFHLFERKNCALVANTRRPSYHCNQGWQLMLCLNAVYCCLNPAVPRNGGLRRLIVFRYWRGRCNGNLSQPPRRNLKFTFGPAGPSSAGPRQHLFSQTEANAMEVLYVY